MRHVVGFSLFLIMLAVLSGCASIISGGGPQAIPVNSNPSEAKLEVTDLITGQPVLTATTPSTMLLNRSAGYFQKCHYKVKVSKDGYMPQEHVLTPGINGWYLGNLLFGGLLGWVIIDPITGAMYKFDETPITYVLYSDDEQGRAALEADLGRQAAENETEKAAEQEAEKVRAAGV